MKKFFVIFLSVILCLSCFGGFRVSADEDDSILNGDKFALGILTEHVSRLDDYFMSNIGSPDEYYYFFFAGNGFSSSDLSGVNFVFIKKSSFNKDYLVESLTSYYVLYLDYFTGYRIESGGFLSSPMDLTSIEFGIGKDVSNNFFISHLKFIYPTGSSIVNKGLYTNLDINAGGTLKFLINPDFTLDMTLNNLGETFTLDAINGSDNYYNYMMYISPHPASVGIHRSLSDAVYIMSSKQWCMKYSWKSTAMTSDDLYDDVVDYVTDLFGKNIFDMWGNALDIAKTYYNSQSDGFNYYQLSQQDNCPFYLIKPKDTKQHVIPYSAMNIDINSDYYVNIIYLDTTAYGVAPANTSPIDFDVNNSYRDHPIYNLNLLYDYVCYAAIQFNFYEGDFTADPNSFKYDDVVDNANPNKSSATISSDDDTVDINTNNSYDNSSSVSYINYGTIYHNCQWGSSGSGTSSGAVPVPDLPAFEFEELLEGSAAFLSFVKIVLFESMPEIFTVMLVAAFAVVIYCRVWGR